MINATNNVVFCSIPYPISRKYIHVFSGVVPFFKITSGHVPVDFQVVKNLYHSLITKTKTIYRKSYNSVLHHVRKIQIQKYYTTKQQLIQMMKYSYCDTL